MENICNEKIKPDGIDGYIGPFDLGNCAQKNYFINCKVDCSRKVRSD